MKSPEERQEVLISFTIFSEALKVKAGVFEEGGSKNVPASSLVISAMRRSNYMYCNRTR